MRRVRPSFVPVVSPAAVRRRARRWAALAGAALASPFAALVPAAVGWLPSSVAVFLALAAVPTGVLILGETCEERPPAQASGARLTARTLTGERTVDLSMISSVRLFTYFTRSGVSERVLLVRDLNGVRLGLKSAGSCAALRQALEPSPPPEPRVSKAALVYLGMRSSRGPLVLHTAVSWLALVFGTCGYMITVLALADRVQ